MDIGTVSRTQQLTTQSLRSATPEATVPVTGFGSPALVPSRPLGDVRRPVVGAPAVRAPVVGVPIVGGAPVVTELLDEVAVHGLSIAESRIPGLVERGRVAGAGPGVLDALADPSLPDVMRTRALARVARLLSPPRTSSDLEWSIDPK